MAVVLMIGLVAAASVSLFVVGAATIDQSQNNAQETQVENTFREFNKDVSSVAFGRQKYRSMNFDVQDQTAAFRQEDTGTIRVEVGDNTTKTVSIGALVYENNGETIAYQAGGVWRNTGKESRMVSRPPVEYQNGSLTFPIPALDGDEQVRPGELNINKRGTNSSSSNNSFVKGELVTLHITSEYYMGWAEYFRTQTNDVAVSVDHSPPGDKGTVKVKLGQPVANGDFQKGVMATGGEDGDICVKNKESPDSIAASGEVYDCKNGNDVDGEENAESDLYELDTAIERKVKNASEVVDDDSDDSISEHDIVDDGDITTAGTYFDSNGFKLSSEREIDVSDGNVTLIIDGNMSIDGGSLDVIGTNTENVVRIYTTGNYSQNNGEVGAGSAKHLQIYGTSEMLAVWQNSATFTGTIYAPRNEPALERWDGGGEANPVAPTGSSNCNGWDMCISTGSTEFKGAIVGGPTAMQQGTTVTYDNELAGVKPTLELEDGVLPPPITFLKVAVHEIDVNNSGSNSLAAPTGLGASSSVVSPQSASATTFDAESPSVARAEAAPARRTTVLDR
ncbi:hypothetical protein G9C85_01135 [Halorubellus sp. JP-L1]|uniref:DUF7289 family protein n=1 Tax=Halorubellus sp. JP-L1 TaxID=2715753 RepID=UPI00140AC4E4|nr:hypothetical protein [Halorubellus sp. JP-L1]NHN40239.1 hypothetical protein [Halorubellus sp. JP-L1]